MIDAGSVLASQIAQRVRNALPGIQNTCATAQAAMSLRDRAAVALERGLPTFGFRLAVKQYDDDLHCVVVVDPTGHVKEIV
jgi:hypothetical protein